METGNGIFDALAYFTQLAEHNRLCVENGFKPVICSGIESLQGVLQEYQKTANFICIDDTADQNMHTKGVTFFKKRVYTVFIVAQYKWDDMKERQQKLNLCRKIFSQFVSRVIHDKNSDEYFDDMEFVNVDNIYSREFGKYSWNGVTGLYFMLENDEPEDLVMEANDWL